MSQITVTLKTGADVIVDRDQFVRAIVNGEKYMATGVDAPAGEPVTTNMDSGFLLEQVARWELYVAP